ncbi:MAG: hypothetical protein ACM34I_12630 [bacterium]
MDDIEKLRHLVSHWQEHNQEHARTYREWADRMEKAGEVGAGDILLRIADKAEELEKDFKDLASALR